MGKAPVVNGVNLRLTQRDDNSFVSGFHALDIGYGIKFVNRAFNVLTMLPA